MSRTIQLGAHSLVPSPVCQVPQDRPSSLCTQVAQEPSNSTTSFVRHGVSTFPTYFSNMIQTSEVLSLQVLGISKCTVSVACCKSMGRKELKQEEIL